VNKRTLSIIIDDDGRKIRIDNWGLFSLIELMGIGEHIRVLARLSTIRNVHEADNQAEEKDADADKGKGEK
jgi:hypothetical protein